MFLTRHMVFAYTHPRLAFKCDSLCSAFLLANDQHALRVRSCQWHGSRPGPRSVRLVLFQSLQGLENVVKLTEIMVSPVSRSLAMLNFCSQLLVEWEKSFFLGYLLF